LEIQISYSVINNYNSFCQKFLAYDRPLQNIFIKQIRTIIFNAFRVLVQGWFDHCRLRKHTNVDKQLYLLEKRATTVAIAISYRTIAIANQQLENLRAENKRLAGRLFKKISSCLNKNNCKISIVLLEPVL